MHNYDIEIINRPGSIILKLSHEYCMKFLSTRMHLLRNVATTKRTMDHPRRKTDFWWTCHRLRKKIAAVTIARKNHMAKQSLQSLLQNLGFRIEQLATTLTDRFEPK